MGQAIQSLDHHDLAPGSPPGESRWSTLLPALLGALICTALIVEAVLTIVDARKNGDLMLMMCPILGATFISIPTVRAWWTVISELRKI